MAALRPAVPALLFGIRLWVSVCLALYVTFWLELDNAYWAGTSAAIVCQPSLGASLRKGWFRLVGTVVGAVAIVVLSACFPQSRGGFLVSLALWGAACGFMATLLRNFAAYAAALAGYTAVIIAGDELGATGGTNGAAFTLAVTRASEICIGIVCAGLVLAITDFGGARRQLGGLLGGISADIGRGLAASLRLAGPAQAATRLGRWDAVRRVVALDPIMDQALGEASDLRYHARTLQAAVDGLLAALSGWRTVAFHLECMPDEAGRQQAEAVLRQFPPELASPAEQSDQAGWADQALRLHRHCERTVRALVALPADTPSQRLLADRTAEALRGLSCAFNGLALVVDPENAVNWQGIRRFRVPDLLPPLVNALRVFLTIGAASLFWIATEWPNGATAITFAAVAVILLSPRDEHAYTASVQLALGTGVGAIAAAILDFAVLPGEQIFAGFCLALGLVLVPLGVLAKQPRWAPLSLVTTANFIPLLSPANQASYDPQQFYNAALGIVGGAAIGALSLSLMPPIPPAMRVRRLLALTLRDLRRLARGRRLWAADAWEARVFGRLSVLPEQAEPMARVWLLAALSVGTEIVRLRRIAPRIGLGSSLDAALNALAGGDSTRAIDYLADCDGNLARLPEALPAASIRLRARGGICVISEALAQHGDYFDGEAI